MALVCRHSIPRPSLTSIARGGRDCAKCNSRLQQIPCPGGLYCYFFTTPTPDSGCPGGSRASRRSANLALAVSEVELTCVVRSRSVLAVQPGKLTFQRRQGSRTRATETGATSPC